MKDLSMSRSKASGRRRSTTIVLLLLAGLSFAGAASAQWEVTDEKTHTALEKSNEHLQKIRDDLGEGDGNVNNNLKKLYDQQKFKVETNSAGEMKAPDVLLDASSPNKASSGGAEGGGAGIAPTAGAGDAPDMSEDKRCPSSGASAEIPQQQNAICKLIYKTEMAKYTYSLKMYDLSKERYEALKKIQEERAALEDWEQGKLQSNTNKLLALIALMEIDRQQQKVYMDAYDSRLTYLQTSRDTLTNGALNGKPASGGAGGGGGGGGVGSIGGMAAGGAILAAGLELLKTKERDFDN